MSLATRLRPARGAAIAVLIYLVMYLVYAISEPSATSVFAITNLLDNTIVLAIAAAGLTLVVLTGEFDLSAIGVIAIANVVVATTSVGVLGWFGSLVAVMLIGAAVGLLNGWLVVGLGLQSLAVTIGTMIACQGVALVILGCPRWRGFRHHRQWPDGGHRQRRAGGGDDHHRRSAAMVCLRPHSLGYRHLCCRV